MQQPPEHRRLIVRNIVIINEIQIHPPIFHHHFLYAEAAGEAAQLFFGACARAGLEPRMTVTYGGSDNNHFCLHGLQGLVVAPGMNSCHSCQEYTSVDELTRAAKLAEALIRE